MFFLLYESFYFLCNNYLMRVLFFASNGTLQLMPLVITNNCHPNFNKADDSPQPLSLTKLSI